MATLVEFNIVMPLTLVCTI